MSEGLTLQTKEEGGDNDDYISGLFLFCTFVVALISLLYQIFRDKRK